MSDKFFPVQDNEKKAELQARLGDHLPVGYKDLSFCRVLQGTLGFYPGWTCLHIHKEENVTKQAVVIFFKEDEETVTLDWKVATILKFNQKAPLKLSIHDITPYVQFFFTNVRAKDGPMKIISLYDELKWREEPSGTVKKALASLIRPPHLISWDEENHAYEVGAHILFHNNLFECRLLVNKDGQIDVTERVLQVEDMPVLDQVAE